MIGSASLRGGRPWVIGALLMVGVAAATFPADAQIPIPQIQRPGAQGGDPRDTITVEAFRVRPPISPLGALWRSMLIPGWSQSILRRRVTGAVFVLWEGVTLVMTVKSRHQLTYLRRVEDPEDMESVERVDSKEREVQDWAVLMAFNHLMAGLEGFVAAQLWDFPEELEVRANPDGTLGLGVTLPLPPLP